MSSMVRLSKYSEMRKAHVIAHVSAAGANGTGGRETLLEILSESATNVCHIQGMSGSSEWEITPSSGSSG